MFLSMFILSDNMFAASVNNYLFDNQSSGSKKLNTFKILFEIIGLNYNL